MNIQTLTKNYKERFVAFNKRIEEIGTDPKKKAKLGKSPNFLKEVLRPILDELPDLLPGYGFKPTTDTYAMYGEYYRIKAGNTLLGGITIKEDFNLVFTPLFHGQPCGKQHDINSMDDLLAALKEQLERREVACKI